MAKKPKPILKPISKPIVEPVLKSVPWVLPSLADRKVKKTRGIYVSA